MERDPEVEAVVRRFLQAAADGRREILEESFSRDPDILCVGTDPNEVWEGQTRLDLFPTVSEELQEVSLHLGRIWAWSEGTVAWAFVEAIWSFVGGAVETRGTTVLHREDGAWRIVHEHASIGVPNDDMGFDLTTSVERIARAVEEERPGVGGLAAPDGSVTIVFTDIEDSTRFTETLGDRAWLEVLRRHDETIEHAVEAQRGIVVKHQGDGFMLAFPSPQSALSCARAIMRAVSDVRVDGTPLRVRAGIHTGEALRRASDFYGRAVVLASRIAARAAGGQVLVSSTVFDRAHGAGAFAFRDLGELELRGLAGTHRLFELVLSD